MKTAAGSARFGTLFLVIGSVFAAPAFAQLDESSVGWSHLELRAKKLGFSVSAELSLGTEAEATALAKMVEASEGRPWSPTGTVKTLRLKSSFAGRSSDATTHFDPTDARAFQQEQMDTGKRLRYKVNRYCEEGVFYFRRVPKDGEAKKAQQDWTGGAQKWNAYPAWTGADLVVADPSSLFYVAAAAPLRKEGDRFQIPVFTRENLLLVEMTVRGTDRVKVDYRETTAGGDRTVKETVQGLRISLDAQHLDPDSSEGDLELLGLQGDVVMVLHPETRTPLELSGKAPVVGKVRVRLVQATLK